VSDSKRLRVLKLLTTWLGQEVSIANGYKHDLAGSVYRGRLIFTDDDPLPCVSILENLNPDRDRRMAGANDEPSRGKGNESWALLIQGWVKEDYLNPCDAAYELMADVKKALAKLYADSTNDGGLTINLAVGDTPKAFFLGGLTNGFEYEPGTVRPPEQPSEKAFFWMRVILKFTERVNDPFDY
jgi:hypothetical protein